MKHKNPPKKTLFNIRPDLLVGLFLVVATLSVYLQVRNFEFLHYDDEKYVTRNEHVSAGLTPKSVSWAFTTTYAEFWHPVTWLSHMLVCEIFGLNPGWHHLAGLFIHIVNSLLLFLIFRKTTGDPWRSGFIAALFALHPLNVESVAWVSERKGLLCALFWMLAMWSYVRYVERPGIRRYLLIILFFILGFMAKAMIITLPFVLVLLDYWPLRRIWLGQPTTGGKSHQRPLHLLREKTPLFILAVLMGLAAFLAQKGGGHLSSFDALPLGSRIASSLISYLSYIGNMIWPFHLSVFYPIRSVMPAWQVAGAFLLLTAISTLVLVVRRRFPYLLVGWLWYIGTLVPVIQLIQVGLHSMADRYTYIPLVGLFIIIAWGVPDLMARWRHRKTGLKAITAVVMLILIMATWLQIGYWKNSITLFEHSSDIIPDNFVAHNILGRAMEEKGRTSEAIIHYTNALKINPYYVDAHYNIGNAYAREGRQAEAIRHYTSALEIKPAFLRAHVNLGNVLVKEGDPAEAIRHYREALRIEPGYAHAHFNIANVLVREGDQAEAIGHYRRALRIRPDYADAHYNLGNVLAKQDETTEAIRHYKEALRINPGFVEAHINLGNELARQGATTEAIKHYRMALQVNPDHAVTHYYLGNILAKQDKTTEAIRHYKEALRINPGFVEPHINLGSELAEEGRTTEALKHYNEALRISPDSKAYVFFNMACIHARRDSKEQSLDCLEKAVKNGFKDWNLLQTDKDLENIRGSRRYKALVAGTPKAP